MKTIKQSTDAIINNFRFQVVVVFVAENVFTSRVVVDGFVSA